MMLGSAIASVRDAAALRVPVGSVEPRVSVSRAEVVDEVSLGTETEDCACESAVVDVGTVGVMPDDDTVVVSGLAVRTVALKTAILWSAEKGERVTTWDPLPRFVTSDTMVSHAAPVIGSTIGGVR